MVSITDKLEGLLPADGNYTTKDERVIAEAVKELRLLAIDRDIARSDAAYWLQCWVPFAFAAGCIASAIYVVLV